MQYIRNTTGTIIGTQTKQGDKLITRDFTTNKVVSTFNERSNKTWDTKSNTQTNGDQSLRSIGK